MAPAMFKIANNYSVPEQMEIEMALETVRRVSFTNLPCRQNVFYACMTLSELKKLNNRCNRKQGFHGNVYEIDGKSFGPFDTLAAFTRWSDDLLQRSRCYWRGLETPQPLHEYLVTLPVRIGRQVGTL